MTEPLSAAQKASVGWAHRQGVGDASNMFHYYRLTRDDRILWGGYDAVYHFGSRIDRALEQRPETHELLAEHFFARSPSSRGCGSRIAWGGVIDTCTRFTPFFGTAYGGRVAYALGYTGLGVAATRFGADVALDLLAGERDGADAAGDGPREAVAVPARAAPVGRHLAHAPFAGSGSRRARGAPERVAAGTRPGGPGLRLLSASASMSLMPNVDPWPTPGADHEPARAGEPGLGEAAPAHRSRRCRSSGRTSWPCRRCLSTARCSGPLLGPGYHFSHLPGAGRRRGRQARWPRSASTGSWRRSTCASTSACATHVAVVRGDGRSRPTLPVGTGRWSRTTSRRGRSRSRSSGSARRCWSPGSLEDQHRLT